ncbi:MAG: hypothetical protein HPY74_06610 [Firmicutes bacterium]|nr:hypothetical protein [Bacillota bacterium]
MPGIGKVKLAIVKNGYNVTFQNTRFIITDMLDTPAQGIVKKYLKSFGISKPSSEISSNTLTLKKCRHVTLRSLKVISLQCFFHSYSYKYCKFRITSIQLVKPVIFLQDFVQIKVNNVVYIINVTSKDLKSKQVNDVTDPVATTIWDKLSA